MNAFREGAEYICRFRCAVSDGRRLHIITDYIDGFDLFEHFIHHKMGPNTVDSSKVEERYRHWMAVWEKIAYGVAALHKCGVAHMDISIENIMNGPTPLF